MPDFNDDELYCQEYEHCNENFIRLPKVDFGNSRIFVIAID
jgi:hypothetical protein